MKFKTGISYWMFAVLAALVTVSCESRDTSITTAADVTAESPTARAADSEYKEFADWANHNASRADTATEEEWHKMKTEFNRRSMELEGKTSEWSDETRQAWEELKSNWRETEGRADARWRDDTTTVKMP